MKKRYFWIFILILGYIFFLFMIAKSDTSIVFLQKDNKIAFNNDNFLKLDPLYNVYYYLLNDNEKELYQEIYTNTLNYNSVFLPKNKITIYELYNSFQAVYNDFPELFWLDSTYFYKYNSEEYVTKITLKFNDTINNIEENKILFEKMANSIINEARKKESTIEQEKYVHDILINNITYDYTEKLNQSAFSAIVLNKTVCAGYAKSFQYIMKKLNIPTYYIKGEYRTGHAWNLVIIDNKSYYVDLTLDDNKDNTYQYFNLNKDEISKSHTSVDLSLILLNNY